MVQFSEWTESGVKCGALPADCAPVERESFWQLKRHSAETERHMGRSLQALSSGKFNFQENFIFAGAQSAGSAPHFPRFSFIN